MTTSDPTPESLLADAAWLARLARRLTGDAERARDLQQDVAVAALRAPEPHRLGRAWLAAVAHNLAALVRRRAGREHARLRLLARPEPAPAAAELVATAELQQRAVAAVLQLPADHRDTILLRFLQGLSLEATARELGVPLETVRTRQKRALARLRAALAGDADARPRALALSATTLLGMLMKKQIVVAAGVLALLGLASSPWWLAGESAPQGAPEPTPGVAAAEPGRAPATAAVADEPARRVGVPAAAAPAVAAVAPERARVVVTVRWQDDRGPVVGAPVLCREFHGPGRLARTDAAGVARFDDLDPGGHLAGLSSLQMRPVQAAAGTTTEVELLRPRGRTVAGRVVDPDGAPVPGAELFVRALGIAPSWPFPVGTSAADGSFSVDGVGERHAIGARHRHWGTSRCEQPGEARELVLRFEGEGGGVVLGRVVDGANRPVANAWVEVARPRILTARWDGKASAPAWPAPAASGPDGAFAIEWLQPGRYDLHVYRRGLAPHRQEVEVRAHDRTDVLVVLGAGGTIAGTVSDPDGGPAVGAVVEIDGLRLPQPQHQRVRDDGTFRFTDVPPGEHVLEVVHAGYSRTQHRLTVAAGAEATWDCRLSTAGQLRGRLLDADGAPLVGWHVARPRSGRFATTDARGSFVLTECEPEGNVLLVRPAFGYVPIRHRFEGLAPASTEQELVVPRESEPSARLRGRVLGADGAPLADAAVNLHQYGDWVHNATRTAADGTFDIGPLPPGSYRVLPVHPGERFAPVDVELEPHEHEDVPALRPQPR